MTDMELADWLHRWRECLRCEAPCQAYPCICSQRTDAIIAALRRGHERPPFGEMGYEEYHDGIIGVFKMNADGSRDLKVLTPQASEQFRAMLSAYEEKK